jgi:ATP-dependent Zn protease
MTDEHLRTVAYHEAGHAVVAWALGLKVGAVAIGLNGDDSAGKSEIEENQEHLSEIQRLAICLAGITAEKIFNCKKTHENAHLGDYGKAYKIIGDIEDTNRWELFDPAFQCAESIITENKERVDRLAAHLMDHRRVEATEFLELINQL